MSTIVLATRNAGKIAEFNALLQGRGLTVVGLDAYPEIPDIPETGETFLDNARLKARAVAQATGLVAVADDSGLCVDALDGGPGVYSARYAGEGHDPDANNAKLLDALKHVPDERRTARFVCTMVASAPGGAELVAEAAWEGRIAHGYSGKSGFGYDPIFLDPELGVTAAQMPREVKNARSHRGKALQELMARWPEFWARAGGEG
ncbi:MAG: XTP/dITP diphosphatase [Desulfovibrionaceae bacterium]